jgi:hypothetical protein
MEKKKWDFLSLLLKFENKKIKRKTYVYINKYLYLFSFFFNFGLNQ